MAVTAGIWASAAVGAVPTWLRSTALVVPFALALAVWPACRRGSRPLAYGLVVLAGLAIGFARHQVATNLPPDHIAHLVAGRGAADVSSPSDEAVLTRMVGQVVTPPVAQPAEKRNPYLPFDPAARTRFVLDAREVRAADRPTPVRGLVQVSVEAEILAGETPALPNVEVGDTVALTGRLYAPRGPRNPGETDWARWQRLQGIHAGLAVDGPAYVTRVAPPVSAYHQLTGRLRALLRSLLLESEVPVGDADRLLDAMVLGQRSAPTRQINEVFVRTGTVHFLSVSGFHVGVLGLFVWFAVRRLLRAGPRLAAGVTIGVLLSYLLVAEHTAPVLRATVMAALACAAIVMRRPLCVVNWLALSAACILMINPLELFHAGFQLSFVQVLGLVLLVPPAYRWLTQARTSDTTPPPDADTLTALVLRRSGQACAGLAIVSACAWLLSIPLVLYHFGRFSPLGFLHSVLITPLVTVTIVAGFATLVLGVVPALGPACAATTHALTEALLWLVAVLARWPGTLIEARVPPLWLVLGTYGLALALWTAWRARLVVPAPPVVRAPRWRGRLLVGLPPAGMAALWSAWALLPPSAASQHHALQVLSVGRGSAIVLTTPDRHAVVFDAGTVANLDVGATVTQTLRALGVRRLEAVTVSHANFDHYSGVHSLLAAYRPERIYVNAYLPGERGASASVDRLYELLPAHTPDFALLRAGDTLSNGDVESEVLWPPDGLDRGWKTNDRSLVLRIHVHGRTVLIPGDIERDAIRGLLAAQRDGRVSLKSDVLIAPHHGSVLPRDTAEFYAAVAPHVVVVSTGKPRPELAALVREAVGPDCRVYSTRAAGAVRLEITAAGALRIEVPFAHKPSGSSN